MMLFICDTPLGITKSATFKRTKLEIALNAHASTSFPKDFNLMPFEYEYGTFEYGIREVKKNTLTTVEINDAKPISISNFKPEMPTFDNLEINIPLLAKKSFFIKAKIKKVSKFQPKPFLF